MSLYEKIKNKEEAVAVIGLGYVGLPIAAAFAEKGVRVIGYDVNTMKINQYKNGIDSTGEVGDEALKGIPVCFTDDERELMKARFHIVAVPTPVNQDKTPDLTCIREASIILGRNLTKGSVVVYESTVYPGMTESICIPIMEDVSGMKCGIDFKVGYSPERINPGDRTYRFKNITKIVSGVDAETVEEIKNVYNIVIEAGSYPVSNIRTAEAIKVIENSQRDVNIAFMNEVAMILKRMDIDTNEVVDGMNTKWNALGFRPGLVGGHCIGVDPYYFISESEKLGYHSQIILSGRKINDGMGFFVADAAIRKMILAGKNVLQAKVVILGFTFKEDCPDIRNTKVIDIISRLQEYGVTPVVVDPCVNKKSALTEYGVIIENMDAAAGADCVIAAVAHRQFREMGVHGLSKLYRDMPAEQKVLIDVKGIFNFDEVKSEGLSCWRL